MLIVNILLLLVAVVVATIIANLTEKISGSDSLWGFMWLGTLFVFWVTGTNLSTDGGFAAFLGACLFELLYGGPVFSIPEGVEIILLNGYDLNGMGANSYNPLF